MCQWLAINPTAKVMQQKKCKMGLEKQMAIEEETYKLVKENFICEVK